VLAAVKFLTEQVFGDSYLELLSLAVLVTAFVTFYRHFECHQSTCHRLGRFTHGHMKLCARHHPFVRNDGKIGAKEIDDVSVHLERERQAAAAAGRPAGDSPPRPPA